MTWNLVEFAGRHWRDAVEITILAIVIYQAYMYLRGTRGAKVFTGLVLIFVTLTLISQLLQLEVISRIIKNLTAFLAIALVIIFQPELRRALAALGSHHFFTSTRQKRETIKLIAEAAFELSSRQLGALIALERDTNIRQFAESGVMIDAELSPEIVVTIFHPKTPLHDGGIIIRDDRLVAAACIFPVSQREDLDRNLGLRHRAALGITEESDAIAVVVSEETGIVSICYRGLIERDLSSESFTERLTELLMLPSDERFDPAQLGGETRRSTARGDALVSAHEKRLDEDAAL
jgi:diadenylate cyclase